MTSFNNLAVEPIFATPLAMTDLKGDPSLTEEKASEFDWKLSDGLGITTAYHFLADFPVLEQQLIEAFSSFKDNILGLYDIEFKITSSWMTLAGPSAKGDLHRHYNSMFTGVYYPFPGEYSPLEISRIGLEATSFYLNSALPNLYTMASCSVHPYEGLAIFFPSHLLHYIGRNQTSNPRYSVAFNLCPCGDIDTLGDSSAHIQAKPIEK